jgi:hypothetical protein
MIRQGLAAAYDVKLLLAMLGLFCAGIAAFHAFSGQPSGERSSLPFKGG